jgi:hypothetical protein
MVSKVRNGVLVLALLWMNSAFATLITFEDRTNVPTGNGEVVGTEWISRGLLLTTPSLALNVGCGAPNPCLGADQTNVSDFNGIINGSFVVPGTLLPTSVFSLGIEFCCEAFLRPPGFDDQTITSIFDTSGGLLARIFDTDFFFASAVPIGSFSVDFGSDAMLGLRFNVPEPGSLSMLLLGLLGVLMLSKRRRCA